MLSQMIDVADDLDARIDHCTREQRDLVAGLVLKLVRVVRHHEIVDVARSILSRGLREVDIPRVGGGS